MNITDVNFESKHKSVSEIKQSILIKLVLNIDQQEKSSLVKPYSFNCNKTSQDKCAEEANQTFGLSQRKKGEKFSKDHIKFIKNLIDTKKTSLKKISSAYSISLSSLRNIQKMSSDILSKPSLRNFEKPSIMKRDQMIFAIKKYYEEIESEFTSSDVQKHLFEHLNISCSLRLIRDIMKNDLNLSFKKCATRPNNVNLNRVKTLRSMYWIQFSELLQNNTLVINIDEWVISRSTKNNYSWSIKGENKEIINSPFIGSVSIILTILSNGWWYLLATDSTIDSAIFWHFIKKLEYWILSNKMFGYSDVLWIMDNCPSHKSNFTRKTLANTKFNFHFLPAYSPNLAPVEMCFSYLKHKWWSLSKGWVIRLKNKNEQNILLRAMKTISKALIKKWFSKLYDTIKLNLSFI